MPKIVVDKTRCKGCERCVEACPQSVISMSKKLNEKGYFFAVASEQPRCIGCRLCAISCPDVAISVRTHAVRYNLFDY